jgi:hypothetical protein
MQQTMAQCEISLVHVSVERQIRELYQYPVEKPVIQFFRDHPDLSFAMCLKMEETILAAVAIYQSTLHTIKDRNQWAGDKDLWVRQVLEAKELFIEEKNTMIQEKETRIEEKNLMIQEKETRIEEKNLMIQEKETRIEEKNGMIQEKETRIEEKNMLIQEKETRIAELKERMELERGMLSAMLERANTEALRLSHNLSVRGMIEKLEYQYSEKRRKEGSDATRKAVWVDILHYNGRIKDTVIKHCSGRNEACKVDAAIEAIMQIYKQTSDEIHQAGYDEIQIRTSALHGIQLQVLRGLCSATFYATREVV